MMLASFPLQSELLDLLLWSTRLEPSEAQRKLDEAYRLLRAEFGPDYWIPLLYRNNVTGKFYRPHHAEELDWLMADAPVNMLAKGGEGSGKSTVGVIKGLERLRRGMNGIMASPDLPHFKKSLWTEFRTWCPWHFVVLEQQRRGRTSWEPHEPFTLTFTNGAQVLCGGMDEPGAWEGGNVSWAHFDEARRKKEPEALKVLKGRVRIPGASGEPHQLWLTTTPRKHWLHDYFGPIKSEAESPGGDPFLDFKQEARVMTLLTEDNERAGNVSEGFTKTRGQGLTQAEKDVLLSGEWADINDIDRFLPSILWWDSCFDPDLPPLTEYEPMVLGLDGAISNDNFALAGITRHPLNQELLAVRYTKVYKPDGQKLDFGEIEKDILDLKSRFNVVLVAYDPAQVHYLITRLEKHVWCEEFSQHSRRVEADVQLLDMIQSRTIKHDGSHTDLRQHIDNADRKKVMDTTDKFRIVKRAESQKIDAAVALSMGCHAFLDKLNL